MQLSFLFTIFFGVFAIAVPLERRDYKEQELRKFMNLKKKLSEIGYNVEEYFCKNGAYVENIIEPRQKAARYHMILNRDITNSLRPRAKHFVENGWNPSEFFCVPRAPASKMSKRADENVYVKSG